MLRVRGMQYTLDEHGQPVDCPDVLEWARWMGDGERRRVELTEVDPGVWVSTVYLGINHNFTGQGAPVLWETMVWTDIPDATDPLHSCDWHDIQRRYSSQLAARTGHFEVCEFVRARMARVS